ncbi:hypothetical protein [Dyadobacter bucti]|uniref:hypothetical protein n=1 Tax=Dyadobacter bucti TaxID=2572203 RepID=UPI003F7067C0
MARRQPTFKPYYQQQLMLLPPSFDELIPKDHACRVVNEVINNINLEPLNAAYHTKGSSSYHPQMYNLEYLAGYQEIFRTFNTQCKIGT